MCGIFGYANYLTEKTKKEISDLLVKGLKRIEYRGYDSAGFCVQGDDNKNYVLFKEVGKVDKLENMMNNQNIINMDTLLTNHVGIAHTRWATHGQPSVINCHPLKSDESGCFLVVHNGIITNYKTIKKFLMNRKYEFDSDTDTEVAAKLALYFYKEETKKGNKPKFIDVVKKVIKRCDGAFSFVFISPLYPNEMVAVRVSSPLLIGLKGCEKMSLDFFDVNYGTKNDDAPPSPLLSACNSPNMNNQIGDVIDDLRKGVDKCMLHSAESDKLEVFLSSDASALIEHTNKVIYLEDYDVAHIFAGNLVIHRPHSKDKDASPDKREVKTIDTELNSIMKGNFDHFMLKEINEQKESVVNTMRGRINFKDLKVSLGGLKDYINIIKKSGRFIFVACGTSYHAALSVKNLFEELLEIPIYVEIASDFLDRRPPIQRNDCVFFISQSGETADSVMALRYCQKEGALCVGVTNVVGSTLSRETQCGIHINAGPEIGVASTKAYTSQFVALVLIALQLTQDNLSKKERREDIIHELENIQHKIARVVALNNEIKNIAEEMKDSNNLILIGRGYQYPICMEGALKIKEITYIHSEGIMAGELKHGPIALVDENLAMILFVTNDRNIDKTSNVVHQITARNGKPLVIVSESIAENFKDNNRIIIPDTIDCLQGLISVIPVQLLSYHLAVARGLNPDFPRNLAKSVTVE
ncbi:Glutamine--fructose-6-phosphate aminotransferase [isomerizing] [Nosema granulosis]|uniref:glutamine--fructose-6-phosphate transaminase (isomerizing) n=1 Tax=Nosema granulosis TaxID=83296 RepID=A0A9P6GZR5_9MICR|nr:Glutamine--fructose-6-phosphate aminotransferase [isomerizing] [Nosema granulosis]